ncbi:exo-alpha-sialidase [Streptomyces caniferus]|uniref:exo-alpha-sialidase n=1 Tax=Streptomyces caniferus TaxID=285557 RepID=UPI0034523DA4
MTTSGEILAHKPDGDARIPGLGVEQRVLMTFRISRDSGRTWGPVTEVREDEHPVTPDNPGGFPPCTCPRCTGHKPCVEAASQVVS